MRAKSSVHPFILLFEALVLAITSRFFFHFYPTNRKKKRLSGFFPSSFQIGIPPKHAANSIANFFSQRSLLTSSGRVVAQLGLHVGSCRPHEALCIISDKAETYPSPKQVCEILNVDLSTLWRWNKRGYLCPSEVGGKRRYKMSDVKRILNGGKR
jgi:Helix-turn-helix domain